MIPSFLDRLIDFSPEKENDLNYSSMLLIENFIFSLTKDIENLLNSRKNFIPLPYYYSELTASIINYGIEDFTNYSFYSSGYFEYLRQHLENIIFLYEKRLKKFKVILKDTDKFTQEIIKFHIEAELDIEDLISKLEIKMFLNLNNFHFKISKGNFSYE